MEKNNVRLTVTYFDNENQIEKTFSTDANISSLNDHAILSMGSVLANQAAISDAGHSNIISVDFRVDII